MKKDERFVERDESERVSAGRRRIADDMDPPHVDYHAAQHELLARFRQNTSTSPTLSAGDIDASWEMAESSGEETAGGSVATPDQSVVDEIGEAIGVTYESNERLKLFEKEKARDVHRWELDPASAEDYEARMKEESGHEPALNPFVK